MWIVKATGGYEYICHVDGDLFAPTLSDAYRYTSKKQAARIAAELNRIMSEGLPYRVVRLRKRSVRLPIEQAKALRAAVMGDRFDSKVMSDAVTTIDAAWPT